jgi:heme-binding HmuY-like protein
MNRTTTCIGIIALALAACSEDPQAPGGAARPDSLTVDATASWAYVNLFEGTPRPVSVTDAANSAAWDIAFFATSVTVNGGAAGPGGVLGYCVCQNGGLSDLQVSAAQRSSRFN